MILKCKKNDDGEKLFEEGRMVIVNGSEYNRFNSRLAIYKPKNYSWDKLESKI